MVSLRSRSRRVAAVAFAAVGLLATPVAPGVIAAADTGTDSSQELPVQTDNGYDAVCGPAAGIQALTMALGFVGIGNVALYSGPGRTGSGCDVISGGGQSGDSYFQVKGMTVGNVDNRSAEPVAVYSVSTDKLVTVVPAGGDLDFAPSEVNFAFYPAGGTPPSDDKGLVQAAVFQFEGGSV